MFLNSRKTESRSTLDAPPARPVPALVARERALTLTGMRGAEARGGATFIYNIRQRYNSGSPATPNQYDGHEETLRNEGICESIGEAESEL